jgi:hypothetical protein
VVVPVVIFALDWLVLGRPLEKVIRRCVPIALCCLPFMIVASAIQRPASEADLLHRPLIAMNSISFYVWKIVWPRALAPDYALTASRVLHSSWLKWCWVIPAIIALALILGRRRREFLAAAMIFLGGVLPVLGLVTFGYEVQSTVADHYLYLSMVAAALAVTAILSRPRMATSVVAIPIVAALAMCTFRQAGCWHDTISLFMQNEQAVPWSFVAPTQVGFAYEKEGHSPDAEPHYRAAVAISAQPLTLTNLGLCLLAQNRLPEAMDLFQKSIALDPKYGKARIALAQVLVRSDRRDEAIEQLRLVPANDDDANSAQELLNSILNR